MSKAKKRTCGLGSIVGTVPPITASESGGPVAYHDVDPRKAEVISIYLLDQLRRDFSDRPDPEIMTGLMMALGIIARESGATEASLLQTLRRILRMPLVRVDRRAAADA